MFKTTETRGMCSARTIADSVSENAAELAKEGLDLLGLGKETNGKLALDVG